MGLVHVAGHVDIRVQFQEPAAGDLLRVGLHRVHLFDVDALLVDLDLLAQIVVALVLAVEDQFHELAADRVGESGVAGKPERGVVPQDGAVLPVGEEDPALVAGHAQDFVFLLQPEGVRLLGISPGGVAAALDFHRPLVIHGAVRLFNPERRPVHPYRLAGDGLLSRRFDPDDGQSRVPDDDRIVLIDTVLDKTDDPGLRQVDAHVGGGQFLLAHPDAVRFRDKGQAHGGEVRLSGQDDRKSAGLGIQVGVGAVDPEIGDKDLPLPRF